MANSKIKLGLKEKSVPQRIAFGRTIASGILNSTLPDKIALAGRVKVVTDDLEVKEGGLGLALRGVPTASDLRDVAWPMAFKGGFVRGPEEVRDP